jgi:hypothetical protein
VYLLGHHAGVDENSSADRAAHNQHGGIEKAQAAGKGGRGFVPSRLCGFREQARILHENRGTGSSENQGDSPKAPVFLCITRQFGILFSRANFHRSFFVLPITRSPDHRITRFSFLSICVHLAEICGECCGSATLCPLWFLVLICFAFRYWQLL